MASRSCLCMEQSWPGQPLHPQAPPSGHASFDHQDKVSTSSSLPGTRLIACPSSPRGGGGVPDGAAGWVPCSSVHQAKTSAFWAGSGQLQRGEYKSSAKSSWGKSQRWVVGGE